MTQVEDAERFTCSMVERVADETHRDEIVTVDMLSNLTEDLGW